MSYDVPASPFSGRERIKVIQDGNKVDVSLSDLITASLAGTSPALNAAGIGQLAGDRVGAPISNVTYAANGVGALTGTYYYNWSYVTVLGETAPWIGTPAALPLAAQQSLVTVPAGPSGVIARRLYRSKAGNTEPKNTFFVAEIAGNADTTFADNTPDANLGAAPNWNARNRGRVTDGTQDLIQVSDQSVGIGPQTNPGYASIAIGYGAQASTNGGLRNTSVGVYALGNVTTGYTNVAVGTHSGNGLTVAAGCTFAGYSSGGISTVSGDFNTAIGYLALNGTTLAAGAALGGGCTVVGAFACERLTAAWNNLIAIGRDAGKYAAGARRLYIDSIDRATDAGCQDNGIIYGEMDASAANQRLRFNGIARLGSINAATVGALPAASAALRGYRGFVTDATVAYTGANIGTTVVGGGANVVPVFCNGAAWVIG